MQKKIFSYLVICFFFLILSKISFSQIQQKVINENDLIRSWQLVSDMVHDRSPNYIPKDTLKLIFYADHTCKGIIVGYDTSLTGSWILNDKYLTIKYKTKSGEEKTQEYRVAFTQSKLILVHDLPYLPDALRTFISIK